ncbi:MAG: phosphate transport system permease protein [Chloroflexota bacterium]|jgi:phosphate transport system permease protein|nr:phosphate transport system permease protein [Chloroflexota bacterium]
MSQDVLTPPSRVGPAPPPGSARGGRRVSLRAARVDAVMRWVVLGAAAVSVLLVVLVVAFLAGKASPVLQTPGLRQFFGSADWQPDGTGGGFGGVSSFGALLPIAGSLMVVALALFIAVPLALSAAIILEEVNPVVGGRVLRPAVELFVGIPSVVYGYLGFVALLPILERVAPPGRQGSGVLAAGVVLAIMVVPTIATLSADGLRSVPRALKEASLALGATRWQTIWRVQLPAARAIIISGVVLGLARAMGEALAVALVIGDVNALPPFREYGLRALLFPTTTMTVTITDGVNQLAINPAGTAARYALALVLLFITFACIAVVRFVNRGSTRSVM